MHVSAYVYMKYLIDATIKLEELKLMPLPRYAELWGIAGPRLVTCGVQNERRNEQPTTSIEKKGASTNFLQRVIMGKIDAFFDCRESSCSCHRPSCTPRPANHRRQRHPTPTLPSSTCCATAPAWPNMVCKSSAFFSPAQSKAKAALS